MLCKHFPLVCRILTFSLSLFILCHENVCSKLCQFILLLKTDVKFVSSVLCLIHFEEIHHCHDEKRHNVDSIERANQTNDSGDVTLGEEVTIANSCHCDDTQPEWVSQIIEVLLAYVRVLLIEDPH